MLVGKAEAQSEPCETSNMERFGKKGFLEGSEYAFVRHIWKTRMHKTTLRYASKTDYKQF